MSGFVKIYGSILRSSIWLEDPLTRLLWIALLTMADAEGFIEGAIPGIAHAVNLPLDVVQRGLEVLQAPDPHSKDPENQGRRVEFVPGGLRILNYIKYRECRSTAQVRTAERVRRWRERRPVTPVTPVTQSVTQPCHAWEDPAKRDRRRQLDRDRQARRRAHLRCHPAICRARGMPVCLDAEHVVELAGAVINYPQDAAITAFATFIRTYADSGQPIVMDGSVFERGRYLFDLWKAQLPTAKR